MVRAWRLMDFGPDLSRLRRTALVVAESSDAAMALCPGELVIPFPVETSAGVELAARTRSVAWVDVP